MKANTIYRTNKTGIFAEAARRPELPKGTIVYAYGPGMEVSEWATTGEGDNIVKLSENYEGAYFSTPFNALNKYDRPVSEKFGIGFYYDLNAPRATDGEINAAIERGQKFMDEMDEKKRALKEARDKARREAAEKFAGIFEKSPQPYPDAAHVAKNVRKDLALNFPGQKFSVRKENGNSIRVCWTDGPTEKAVETIVEKHKMTTIYDPFNPDLPDYEDTAFTDVFGGVQYLWIERSYSEAETKKYKDEILNLCPGLAGCVHESKADNLPGFSEVRDKYADALHGSYWFSALSVARNILAKIDLYKKPGPKPEKTARTANDSGDTECGANKTLSLVDYSAKAFAVIGDTRCISGQLKDLGGKFNARLSCGPGWIFSKKKAETVRAALGF